MAAGKSTISRTVLVFGKTGVGKSSFCQVYSEDTGFCIGDGLRSQTQNIHAAEFDHEGVKVTLIDTPGYFDTGRDNKDVDTILSASVSAEITQLNLVLFFLNWTRITEEEIETINHFFHVYGEELAEFSALVFTHCEDKPQDILQREFDEDTKINKSLFRKGHVFASFPNIWTCTERYKQANVNACKEGLHLIHDLVMQSSTKKDIRNLFRSPAVVELERQLAILRDTAESSADELERQRALLRDMTQSSADELERQRALLRDTTQSSADELERQITLLRDTSDSRAKALMYGGVTVGGAIGAITTAIMLYHRMK